MRNWMRNFGWMSAAILLAYAAVPPHLGQISYGTSPAQIPNVHTQVTNQSSENHLTVISALLPTGYQQIVVVDPRNHTMATYHIEPAQGKIQLKSVRQIAWDLKMEQFNAESPLPSELRAVQPQ